MSETGDVEKVDPDTPQSDPILEISKAFQDTTPNAVQVSFEEFLRTIDIARNVLENSRGSREETPLTLRELEKHLATSDRRHAKRVADEFVRVMDERLQAWFEDHNGEVIDESIRDKDVESSLYPIAPELLITSIGSRWSHIIAEVVNETFDPIKSDRLKTEYALAQIRLGGRETQTGLAARAVVPVQVDALAQLTTRLIRLGLTVDPDSLGDLPPIPRAIFDRYGMNRNTRDIQRWSIDQKIAAVMETPLKEWFPIVVSWLRLDLGSVVDYYEELIEAAERCRLSRGDGVVDERYLNEVPSKYRDKAYPGTPLQFGQAYAESVSNSIEVVGLVLFCQWFGRFWADDETLDLFVLDRILELERNGRWQDACTVADAAIANQYGSSTDMVTAKINRWFCLQQMGRINSATLQEIKLWRPEDDYDAIGKYALLRDYDTLYSALKNYIASARTQFQQRRQFASMPLLKRAMSESVPVRNLLDDPGARSRPRAPKRRR